MIFQRYPGGARVEGIHPGVVKGLSVGSSKQVNRSKQTATS